MNKIKFIGVYFIILFGIIFYYNLIEVDRGGFDCKKINLTKKYFIQDNDVGVWSLYKDEILFDELKYYHPISYGVSNDYLYGYYRFTNGDTTQFLLNLKNNKLIQFYEENEYVDYCQKNKLTIIKATHIEENYNNIYYWYLKPYGLILIMLIIAIIIVLKWVEKRVIENNY